MDSPDRFRKLNLQIAVKLMFSSMLAVCACKPAAPAEQVRAIFGKPGLNWGAFSYPRAITVNPAGELFVVDKSGRVQRFDSSGEFLNGWKMPEIASGKPVGISVHPDGRLFIADTHYNRVMVFDASGQLLGSFGSKGDGPGQFRLVTDVAVDSRGFIYVAEYGGNDRITKWSPNLEFLTSLCEQPLGATVATSRRLSRPSGITIDGDVLWVADSCNHRILKLDLNGRFLASFGEVGENLGQMRWPYDVNICQDGSLLVAEYGNNRVQWFKPTGEPLRTWGTGGREVGELYSPWGAIEAPNGLTYILDSLNNRVQVVEL